MASKRESEPAPTRRRRRPATTPEQSENQLIGLAVDLAAKQLEAGTASAQVITHFLQLGSSRERLQQEKLRIEAELMEAKKEQMASAKKIEELYEGAIKAMRQYNGQEPPQKEGDDDQDIY